MNLSSSFIESFVAEWVQAWNAHDLERILSHYTDDVIIESPLAAKRLPDTKGKVIGKEAVRKYWAMGLSKNTQLNFKVLDVLAGVSGITIYYVNTATKKRVVEMMQFNDSLLVERAVVHYSK